VLVGQDLIRAAGVRATITQVEKYNQAANTFYGKYGALPGDIPAGPAAQFGFAARGQYAGEGDGNGIIEGNYNNHAGNNSGHFVSSGECLMFWVDLSQAALIEGSFNTATSTTVVPASTSAATSPSISTYIPPAKLGNNNYVYVWSGGLTQAGNDINYFELSAVSLMNDTSNGTATIDGGLGLTVAQAYAIDTKVDDGYPQSGNVLAIYLSGAPGWTGPPSSAAWGSGVVAVPYTNPVSGSPTTCFDNGGGSSQQAYSLEENGGAGINCALSFKMQAGD
jgi:hypothetical protein